MPLPRHKKGKVLIVEDESIRAADLGDVLKEWFDLSALHDISKLEETVSHAAPDAILIGSVGFLSEEARAFLSRNSQEWRTPVLVVACSEDDQIQALTEGAADSILRSSNPAFLKLKLRNLIAEHHRYKLLVRAETLARERISDLESLIQMVAHDLKSPVAAVHGFVGLLKRRCANLPADTRRDEILHYLHTASKSIQDFLKDLAQLFVFEKLELSVTKMTLMEAIDHVLHQYQHVIEERNLSLTVECPGGLPAVKADRRRIIQVLDNLLSNAITHMGERKDPEVRIQLCENGDYVLTSVSDNGIGISPEFHRLIFERFFRVPGEGKALGTGLGLSIAKSIVESHGGRIWVESECGKGCTFRFTLPKDRDVTAAPSPASPREE